MQGIRGGDLSKAGEFQQREGPIYLDLKGAVEHIQTWFNTNLEVDLIWQRRDLSQKAELGD